MAVISLAGGDHTLVRGAEWPIADDLMTETVDPGLVTAQLGAVAWLIAIALAVPLGVASALKRNSWLDVCLNAAALWGAAMPNFLLALLLMYLFAITLGWFPVSGFVPITDNPIDSLRTMAMPVIALSTSLMAGLMRQTRSAMLEVLREDYIRTARAKGVTSSRILFRHALKNALIPVVTVAALQMANLASGTIIVETLFAIPGMGRLTLEAILRKDFATIQIVALLFAIMAMMANLAADLLYVVLDPRIRLQ